ncbi:MAG: 4-hydroxy-tetrahydrodipicolinate synthase [Pseudomonadales bacterium]|jgi:4-hydroxy-tetrahydrodipicolinate synthase|nr:4-hydroxy-tetrahydrodipicolinate synthase [Pseudomonadales bacterium]
MFKGSIVAIVTPMDARGDLDWEALDALVEWHVREGTRGIVPVGTTGESATLSIDENVRVVERVVRAAGGRVPVIAGTGANNTREALEMTRAARSAGADASLQVTPYYNRPTQEGLYRHFATIAEDVDLPMVLYNVPKRTGCDLLAETVARLAPLENVVAIKEACGQVERVTAIHEACGAPFPVLSGEDPINVAMMRAGAVGAISVTANVAPARMAAMLESALAGDWTTAEAEEAALAALHEALFVESNPIPVKWALHEMGRIGTGIRLPLTPLAEPLRDGLRAVLGRYGLLGV